MSQIRLAAAGAIALGLSAVSTAASAGCYIGCGFMTPHGHYPTIYKPAALYYTPPAYYAPTYYSYAPPVTFQAVTQVETATVLAPVTVLKPVRVQRVVTRYLPTVGWGY